MSEQEPALLTFHVREGAQLVWLAQPECEIYIAADEPPAFAVRYVGGHLFAFTETEKLSLPAAAVDGVVTISIRRSDLMAAQRVPRDPENDPDDIFYDHLRWADSIDESEFSVVFRGR